MYPLTCTDIDLIPMLSIRTVKCWFTFVAVNALCVMLTVLADTTTFVLSMDVQR